MWIYAASSRLRVAEPRPLRHADTERLWIRSRFELRQHGRLPADLLIPVDPRLRLSTQQLRSLCSWLLSVAKPGQARPSQRPKLPSATHASQLSTTTNSTPRLSQSTGSHPCSSPLAFKPHARRSLLGHHKGIDTPLAPAYNPHIPAAAYIHTSDRTPIPPLPLKSTSFAGPGPHTRCSSQQGHPTLTSLDSGELRSTTISLPQHLRSARTSVCNSCDPSERSARTFSSPFVVPELKQSSYDQIRTRRRTDRGSTAAPPDGPCSCRCYRRPVQSIHTPHAPSATPLS